jgi:hypothetical protein
VGIIVGEGVGGVIGEGVCDVGAKVGVLEGPVGI